MIERVMKDGQAFSRVRSVVLWLAAPCLLCLGLFVAGPVAVANGAGWLLPAADVSDAEGFSYRPQVAVGPDGTTTIVWVQSNTATGTDELMAATRVPGSSAFSEPERISDGSQAQSPDLVIGPDGTTTVVWGQVGEERVTIHAASRAAGSPAFSTSEEISSPTENAYGPRVAAGPDGSVTVVWYRSVPSSPLSYLAVDAATRPPGTDRSFADPVVLSEADRDSLLADIATAANGTTTVVWSAAEGGDSYGTQAVTRPSGSETFSDPVVLGSDTDVPKVATGPGGLTTVVWNSLVDGDIRNVQAVTRNTAGGFFSAPVDLAQDGSQPGPPELAIAADGTTTVVWQGARAGGGLALNSSTRPAGLDAFGSPVEIGESQSAFLFSMGPAVASGPSGATTVSWTSLGGEDGIVQATTGTLPGIFPAPSALSSTGGFSSEVDVAVGPCGKFTTVVWQSTQFPDVRIPAPQVIQQASQRTANCRSALGKLRVEGPRIVKRKRKTTFRVRIRNTGDAAATGLRVRAKGRGVRASRKAGALASGRSKTVRVRLRFKKRGTVRVAFTVTSSNAGRKVVRRTVRVR